MITDYQETQKQLLEAVCRLCNKKIKIHEKHYQVTAYRKHDQYCTSEEKLGAMGASAAIIKFHNECWHDIAGEEYTFDPEIWK